MQHCVADQDLTELAQGFLQGFDQRVSSLADDACVRFNEEAQRLDAELLSHYRLMVMLARKAPADDLTAAASLWGTMVAVCDDCASRLKALHERHPSCGADFYWNRVLDLRNKCSRLRSMHS